MNKYDLTKRRTEIDSIDFSLLKLKLRDKKEGEGWVEEKCDMIEREYKRFLQLILRYPDQYFVPSMEIDIFWHYHILDTHHYVDFTQRIFGKYLHHYPYMGLFEQDQQELLQLFCQTKKLYTQEFSEEYPMAVASAGLASCRSNCVGRCRN